MLRGLVAKQLQAPIGFIVRLLTVRIGLFLGLLALIMSVGVKIVLAPLEPQVVFAQSVNEDTKLEKKEVDPRIKRLEDFFDNYGCPQPRNTELYISTADKYNIDWRLLPAISVKESTCGKFVPHWCKGKVKSNNYWGYQGSCYSSSAQGIENILYELRNESPWAKLNGNIDKILYLYNGTVERAYPGRVKKIMSQI